MIDGGVWFVSLPPLAAVVLEPMLSEPRFRRWIVSQFGIASTNAPAKNLMRRNPPEHDAANMRPNSCGKVFKLKWRAHWLDCRLAFRAFAAFLPIRL
jgi:hypothetical protein